MRNIKKHDVASGPHGPPVDILPSEKIIWNEEFGSLPTGHMKPSDAPAMLRHVRLIAEARSAYREMLKKERSRDAASHWRSCEAMVMSSARSLRLLPQTRIEPRRAGLLQVRPDSAIWNDPDSVKLSAGNWRDLFPNAEVKPPR